jgi:hypothetical protein
MYQHTQFGGVLVVVLGAALILTGALSSVLPPSAAFINLFVIATLVVCLFLFYNLTVEIDAEYVRLRFGIGLIQKKFRLSEIRAVQQIRTNFFYGWGIHYGPHGWLFNVSGYDAVELEMKGGAHYCIGTDEPDRLCFAIRNSPSCACGAPGDA